jgi:hypothetical protein
MFKFKCIKSQQNETKAIKSNKKSDHERSKKPKYILNHWNLESSQFKTFKERTTSSDYSNTSVDANANREAATGFSFLLLINIKFSFL